MKKFSKLFAISLFAAWVLNSCLLLEMEDDCMECHIVKYEDGAIVEQGDYNLYCGDELLDIQNQEPAVVGNLRSEWECK